MLLVIEMPSSVVEMCFGQSQWRMPTFAVAMLGGLPLRCSGRALRDKIGRILGCDFVPTAILLSTARR